MIGVTKVMEIIVLNEENHPIFLFSVIFLIFHNVLSKNSFFLSSYIQ
jgi:hypothetical protein